jgi:SpoVK/Ycf46/Vps4 family AAA+-type ATPase
MTDTERLEKLFLAQHRCIAMTTVEEDEALTTVRTAAVNMGIDSMLWSISEGLRDGAIAKTARITDSEHPAAALYHLGSINRRMIVIMLDLGAHLKDERTQRLLRDLLTVFERTGSHLVMINAADDLPTAIRAQANYFELSLPDEEELEHLLKETLRELSGPHHIQNNLSKRDMQTIVRNLRGLTTRQAKRVILDCLLPDARLDASDVNAVLAHKRKQLQIGGLLEYIESPVSLDEIGGLRRLKYWLEQRRECLGDEAIEFGLAAPRGVLMLGVQGAGKSLSAKAVATGWQRPLLRMDVGALYDKYIGESEHRLKDALRQAEMMAPIILWIDEIEKAFASAAAQSSDGGLSKRMFGTLLTWMQEHQSSLFLVATANDIEALPPELLRKGRFDEIFFVDLPDEDARRDIFSIHLKKRKRDPRKFDLDKLAAAAKGFSGAEIEQAILAAMHDAFAVRAELTTDGILKTLVTSPPLSVTMSEQVAELRAWAQGRCVPAD